MGITRVRKCTCRFARKLTHRSVVANVQKLMIIAILQNCLFFVPVFLPIILEGGLAKRDIFWLEEMFCLSMLLCTLPAGALSACA